MPKTKTKKQSKPFIESETVPDGEQEDGYLEFTFGGRKIRLDFTLTVVDDEPTG